jgi:DCN1-like protein 4/5
MSRRTKRAPATKAAPAEKATALFEKYKDPADDVIGPEGVEQLCADLKMDPSDRRVLLLAWKMGAQRMGFFTRQEFEQGMRLLRAKDMKSLATALDGVEDDVESDPDTFQNFYLFAFQFCLTEPRQKIIDLDTAIQMLEVVMPDEPHLEQFTEFLRHQTEYKAINKDQWTSFWRFAQEVKPDCSDYDESQAWPLLLDNYVDWRRKHLNGSS